MRKALDLIFTGLLTFLIASQQGGILRGGSSFLFGQQLGHKPIPGFFSSLARVFQPLLKLPSLINEAGPLMLAV